MTGNSGDNQTPQPVDNEQGYRHASIDGDTGEIYDVADTTNNQPVDELNDILRDFMAYYLNALDDLTFREELEVVGEHDLARKVDAKRRKQAIGIEEAKARLLQWGTRQRIDELNSITFGAVSMFPGQMPVRVIEKRKAELQASLKDGGTK